MTLYRFSYEQVFDANGDPLPGAQLYFYASGTSTPKNTYSDAGLTVANSNPVIADSAGRFGPIFLLPEAYKVVLRTAPGALVWTSDPEDGATEAFAGDFSWGGTAGLSGNAYSISLLPKLQAYVAGQTTRFMVATANPSVGPTLNIDGIGAKPLVTTRGIPLQAGWMRPGVYTTIYDGTNQVVPGVADDIVGYTLITSNTGSIAFTLPSGYRLFDIEGQGLQPQTSSGLQIGLQVSLDSGVNWIATGYTNLTRITNASGVDVSSTHATTNIAMTIYDPAANDTVGYLPGTFRTRLDTANNLPQFISNAIFMNRNGGGTAFRCSMDVKTYAAGQVSPINAVRVLMSGGNFVLGGRVLVRAIA